MVTPTATSPAPFARAVGAVLGLAALLAALVVTASPASAHARLESSSPADGSTLTAVPPEIMLRFNEPIKEGLNQVSVKSGSTDVTDGDVQIEGNALYQPVKYSMKPGTYSVSYKVVSADGHPVSGTLSFTYDPPEGDTGAGEEPGATATSSGTGSGTSSASQTPSSTAGGTSGDASSSSDEPSATSPESEDPSSTSGTSESTSTSSSEPADTASDEPSSTSSTSDPAVADADETSGDDGGISPWWIAAGAAVLAVILGGIALLAKGRRGAADEEDITIDEWRE